MARNLEIWFSSCTLSHFADLGKLCRPMLTEFTPKRSNQGDTSIALVLSNYFSREVSGSMGTLCHQEAAQLELLSSYY